MELGRLDKLWRSKYLLALGAAALGLSIITAGCLSHQADNDGAAKHLLSGDGTNPVYRPTVNNAAPANPLSRGAQSRDGANPRVITIRLQEWTGQTDTTGYQRGTLTAAAASLCVAETHHKPRAQAVAQATAWLISKLNVAKRYGDDRHIPADTYRLVADSGDGCTAMV